MKEHIKLSQWSALCMLSTTVLDNLMPSEPPLAEVLFLMLLLVLPGIGAVLDVMSLRREGWAGWTIVFLAFNMLLALLGLFRLIITLSGG